MPIRLIAFRGHVGLIYIMHIIHIYTRLALKNNARNAPGLFCQGCARLSSGSQVITTERGSPSPHFL
jgi:hypothetical protein